MEWEFDSCRQGRKNTTAIGKEDVVIIPAFGIPAADIDLLGKKGCVVVDTTCGSVLNVWEKCRALRTDRCNLRHPREI
jgi:4-hydroxy-3-methylbut-2-enyl diphosphate reductase IspH